MRILPWPANPVVALRCVRPFASSRGFSLSSVLTLGITADVYWQAYLHTLRIACELGICRNIWHSCPGNWNLVILALPEAKGDSTLLALPVWIAMEALAQLSLRFYHGSGTGVPCAVCVPASRRAPRLYLLDCSCRSHLPVGCRGRFDISSLLQGGNSEAGR